MGRALRRHDITLLVFLREGPNKSGLLFSTVLLLCVFGAYDVVAYVWSLRRAGVKLVALFHTAQY